MKELTRRDFMVGSAAVVTAAPLARTAPSVGFQGPLCLFSKHLPDTGWKELGQSVKAAGFDGVDLTVRPAGHVLPERAAQDLEPAVETIRGEGVEPAMLTTALLSAEDPAADSILAVAGRLKVPFLKPGYYQYQLVDVAAEVEAAGRRLATLVALAARHHVQVGYHNHAGYLGGPVWDIQAMIAGLDPKSVGYYFDIRHAVVEGGGNGWRIATRLVSSRLKMIAIKDFYWDKVPGKGWQQRNCPLGEGMVDWPAYCQMIAQSGFQGPASLHLEYDIPGSSRSERQDNTLVAAKKDLEFLRKHLDDAYSQVSERPADSKAG